MKIGIITFHFPYNCGAGLQCVALQRVLEKMGHEVLVINYCPEYHRNLYRPLRNPFISGKKGYVAAKICGNSVLKQIIAYVKGFAFACYSWKNYSAMKQTDEMFSQFINKHMNITAEYKSLNQLRKNPPQCGLYISGSDQLWNSTLTGLGFDEAYFLKFGPNSAGRITYAVSANFPKQNTEFEQTLRKLLEGFDAISLRESNIKEEVVKCASGIPVYQSIDPTLLLDEKQYDDIMSSECLEDEPYILTYCITSATQRIVNQAARELGEKTGLKVVNTLCYPKPAGNQKGTSFCAPDKFLWYIRHADYIITDSFHGTVFSLLMRKPFVTVPRGSGDVRTAELLTKLGIKGHLATDVKTALAEIVKPIDYDDIQAPLNEMRKESLSYISNSIQQYGNSAI